MATEKIKKDLLEIFDRLLSKYPLIGIKYEYNTHYGCFITSMDVNSLDSKNLENFSQFLFEEVTFIQNKYGEDAPLFCLNEEWFKLSDRALAYSNMDIIREEIDDLEWTDFIEEISLNITPQPVHLMEYKEVGEIPLAA